MYHRMQALCLLLLHNLHSALAAGITETSCAKSWSNRSTSNDFSVHANIWNPGRVGSQCVSFLVEEDQFNATWWWKDGHNSVRSYPHATFLHHDLPIKLSNISVLTVKGSWSANVTPEKGSSKTRSLSSAKARFNVAVDMFLHADPELAQNETTSQYEIMVWIGSNENPKPLGYSNGVKLIQRTANHSFSLYAGTNHRGIKTFSWLTEDDLYDFDLDLLDLAIPLVQKDLIPYATYLGLVEFGTETFFASDNVTFTARDFAMSLNTTPDTPTLDIPTPEVPGTGSCLDFGILRRLDVLVMIGLGYLFFHM